MDFTTADRWAIRIRENGTWECEHVDGEGVPQPSTLLSLDNAQDEWPAAEPEQKRYLIPCLDCGTWWRVAAHYRNACYYAAPPFGVVPLAARHPHYLQPVRRDIHKIIEAVHGDLPECSITQEAAYLPGSQDDGIWYFILPGIQDSVQIESSSGMCPFVVETCHQSSAQALRSTSIAETVTMITTYLKAVRDGLPPELEGELYWAKYRKPA